MDTIDVHLLIEVLGDRIDDLEEAVSPLLSSAVAQNTDKLPLLDKAQLYVLVTYAIESVLFSYLRLNGINSKEHSVFRELTRVKQYFEKIKFAENPGDSLSPVGQLNKTAASRFIKHALSGNDKYDHLIAEQASGRKVALEKRLVSHLRKHGHDQAWADQVEERKIVAKMKAQSMTRKRKREGESDDESEDIDDFSSSDNSVSSSSEEDEEMVSATARDGRRNQSRKMAKTKESKGTDKMIPN